MFFDAKRLTTPSPASPSYIDKIHKKGLRMCPKSSDQFPGMILGFQVNVLRNKDPAWQMETRPMLAPMLDKALKKKFDNHVSSYRTILKKKYGEFSDRFWASCCF